MQSCKKYIFLLFCLFSAGASAQNEDVKQVSIKKAEGEIIIDGYLDESSWLAADKATDFFQNFPYDTSLAKSQTAVKLTFDDQYLYIGAVCFDPAAGDYVIQSLKRDFDFQLNDAFAVFIDPFNDHTNGFSFSVSALGVQREGLIQGGGGFGSGTEWDYEWYSEVQNYPDKWVAEIAIPFKALRYKEKLPGWGINFARNDLKSNERSTWMRVPRNFNVASLAFTGELLWQSPPPDPGANIVLIPYATAGLEYNYLADTIIADQWNEKQISPSGKFMFNAGLDAKIAVTPSLNLDLTFNPDFSQVEVDEQQVNLTRFQLFFPEKRQFFIENSDLFSDFGFRQIRPFFSRKIGLYEVAPFQFEQVPILFGAKLSGKLNRDWRIGLINVQTNDAAIDDGSRLSAQNYTVAAFQRQVLKNSNIAGIFVNRQAMNGFSIEKNDYNRVAGIDFNYASANNRWRGKVFYHQAFTPQKLDKQFAHAVWWMYNSPKLFWMWNHEYVAENYIAEVGFVPRIYHYNPEQQAIVRRAYWRFEPLANYSFYPNSDVLLRHGPGAYLSHYLDKELKTTELLFRLSYSLAFQNTSEMNFHYNREYTFLEFPANITGMLDTLLPAGDYHYQSVSGEYSSNVRKKFTTYAFASYGSFYNGRKFTIVNETGYRLQPYGSISAAWEYNKVALPEPFSNASILLIGPKFDFSLNKYLFFTTFIQYNTQVENLNFNGRLQWRFRPMSDLFIVYTDNYDTMDFGKKTRALIVKLTYWITI